MKFKKLLIFLIPLFLFVPNFYIHAESSQTTFSDAYNFDPEDQGILVFSLSNFQNSDSYFQYKNLGVNPFYSGSGNYYQYFDNDLTNGEVLFDGSFDPTEFPYFFINGVGNTIVITCHNYYDSILWTSMCGEQPFDVWQCSFDLGTQTQSSWTYYADQGQIYNYNGNYYYYLIRGTDYVNLYANTPMYLTTAESSLSGLANSGTFAHLSDKTSSGDFKDANFNLDLYSSGGGSDSGENASNNLYMQNPNWQFRNIPSFGSLLDTNSKGQAIFSGQLTDYQKEHLDNFRLEFSFNTFWSGQTFSIASDDVTQVRHDFSKSFLYQVQVPLSEFYSGGSMYSFYIDDIFENSILNDSDQTLNEFVDFYIHEYNHNTNTFRTAFTVNLVALDNSGQSGSCTAYYSYKTGTSQTTNNSMGINSNPYVDEDGNASGVTDPTQDPSGDGSGSGVGNVGDGSIVNNNNPVININNNNSLSDGDSDGLISKILLMIANNQSATSSGIEEIADTSGFVELMGATWLAVPTSWWTTLTAAFIASIGILVVGFIIKIIIGLIF